jgi:hypothetical protein
MNSSPFFAKLNRSFLLSSRRCRGMVGVAADEVGMAVEVEDAVEGAVDVVVVVGVMEGEEVVDMEEAGMVTVGDLRTPYPPRVHTAHSW